jgi:hypothetical protein
MLTASVIVGIVAEIVTLSPDDKLKTISSSTDVEALDCVIAQLSVPVVEPDPSSVVSVTVYVLPFTLGKKEIRKIKLIKIEFDFISPLKCFVNIII